MINTINNFNFDNLHYSKPNIDSGSITLPLYYQQQQQQSKQTKQQKTNCLIQIPMLKLCDEPKSKLLLPLLGKNENDTDSVKKFFNMFDNFIIDKLKEIGKVIKPFFKIKNITYNPIVKELENDLDNNYKNGLVVLDYNNALIYDDKKTLKDKNILTKDCFIKLILEFSSIIINTETNVVHVNINVLQIKKDKEDKINKIELTEYSFIDSDESDESNEINKDDASDLEINNKQNDILNNEFSAILNNELGTAHNAFYDSSSESDNLNLNDDDIDINDIHHINLNVDDDNDDNDDNKHDFCGSIEITEL